MDWELIFWGTAAGFGTAAMTFIGALPALFDRSGSAARQNLMLGFAAGVMLSASYLSLIVPAATFAERQGLGPFGSAGMVALAVLAGAASLAGIRRARWFQGPEAAVAGEAETAGRRVWLLLIAMTAHNLPEGVAVGVSFGAGYGSGLATAIGIGVQDLPEGLAVAMALRSIGHSGRSAFLIGGATGLVEPIGAFLGVSLIGLMGSLLPVGMGWAAGAMIYIVAAELIPAVHQNGHTRQAIRAFLVGLCAMLFLDIALG